MKSSKLIKKIATSIALSAIIPLSSYAAEASLQLTDTVIINGTDQQVTIYKSDLEKLMSEKNYDINELLFPENSTQSISASGSAYWKEHIKMIMNGRDSYFVNFTSECRWAIFNVSNTSGYSETFSHKAYGYQTFGWPPYAGSGNSGGSYTKSILSTLQCSSTAPGTKY